VARAGLNRGEVEEEAEVLVQEVLKAYDENIMVAEGRRIVYSDYVGVGTYSEEEGKLTRTYRPHQGFHADNHVSSTTKASGPAAALAEMFICYDLQRLTGRQPFNDQSRLSYLPKMFEVNDRFIYVGIYFKV
jgi:hypothetical protein